LSRTRRLPLRPSGKSSLRWRRMTEVHCSCVAPRPLEASVKEAIALLDAIAVGRMFVRPPPGSTSESKHVAAEALLEVVRKRLADGLEHSRRVQRRGHSCHSVYE
jgi:hypothetical protein